MAELTCSICESQFDLEGGGIAGDFGICPESISSPNLFTL